MSGRSGEAIVFVHGVGSTAAIWDRQLQQFGGTYRCFAVELRGNGVSQPEPPPQKISREAFAQDVLTVADAAGVERFHFVGCSLGGVVAFELWKRVPERLASLTFVGSFAAYDDGAAYARGICDAVRAAGSMPGFALDRVAKLGLPPGERTDETVAQMGCKSTVSYVASTAATWTGDYRAILGSITAPALVIFGERDAVAPERYAREIAQGVPGARLEKILSAGHVANADAPEQFNGLLAGFLKGIA